MTAKLLLADDSVTVRRVIELTFADEDIQVIAVGDGQQAIEQIEAERPDIVLADVDMPHLTGYDVAAHVKQAPHLQDVPVLLLSGAFDPVDEARMRAAGCAGVLMKPFEPQTVVARVRELLARRPGGGHAAGQPPPVEQLSEHAAGSTPLETVLGTSAPEDSDADSRALDEYFSQLDAALASLTGSAGERAGRPSGPQPAAGLPEDPQPGTRETLADEPGGADLPGREGPAGARPQPPAQAPPPLVEAFTALLAAEDRGAMPAGPSRVPGEAPLSEELVEAVAKRVLERLTDRVIREVVSDVALETAERLVREEIERIRRGAGEEGG